MGTTDALVTGTGASGHRGRADTTTRLRGAFAKAMLALMAGLFAALFAGVLAGPLAGVAGAGGHQPAGASERTVELLELRTDAVVARDGSMAVTERWTYSFVGGPFEYGFRTFESDLEHIVDFTAADGTGPLPTISPRESVSGAWEWRLRAPTSDAVTEFVLTYRVVDAVRIGSDVGDLNWRFLGTDHDGIGRMSVVVTFEAPSVLAPAAPAASTPADDDAGILRGWGHGDDVGTVEVVDGSVRLDVSPVSPGAFVEARLAIPVAVFDRAGTDPLLAAILAQERDLISGAGDPSSLRWSIPLALAVGGTVAVGVIWRSGGREPRSVEVLGDYWREPLTDPPALVLATVHRGAPPAGELIAATLVDLAQRGVITIAAETRSRIGPDEVVHRIEQRAASTEVLAGYERDVLGLVLRGGPSADTDELTDWGREHPAEARRRLDSLTASAADLYRQSHYEARASGPHVRALIATVVSVAVGSGLSAVLWQGGWWVLGVSWAAVLGAVGGLALRNRTQAGAEAAARAAGVRRFLRDFSALDDAPIGHLVLWERFLVDAVTLGVADELIRGLAARLPEVLADPQLAGWYTGAAGTAHLDSLALIGRSTAAFVTTVTPSSSGTGGGFSSGSSGGGGGGSAGAR